MGRPLGALTSSGGIMYSRYSPLEKRILDEIPIDGRRINTIELTGKVYEAGKTPRFARQSVLHTANVLIEKSDQNNEPWEIFKSGGKPAYFWRKPRKESNVA
jgi:hypothetical protein